MDNKLNQFIEASLRSGHSMSKIQQFIKFQQAQQPQQQAPTQGSGVPQFLAPQGQALTNVAQPIQGLTREAVEKQIDDLVRSGDLKTATSLKNIYAGRFGDETTDKETKKQAATLRKEFNSEAKNLGFKEVQSSWQKVSNANKTGAGDLSIVYSFIKALDPTTAVREGEIDLTKAAESIPNRFIKAYQRAKEGKVISNELRNEMINEVGSIYNEKAKQQQQLNAFYTGLATDMGVSPKDVIGGVGEIKLAPISSKISQGKKDTGITGALGEFLFNTGKGIAQPFITTAQTGITAGQTGASMALRNVAPDLASKIGRADIFGSQETARKYSEQPEEAFKEQLGASFQLALPKLLGMVGKGVGKIGQGIKGTFSKSAIGVQQKIEEAAAGVLDTKGLKQAGDYFVKKINPVAKSSWRALKTSISNKTSAGELMEKLTSYGSKGYTAAGNKSEIAEGELKRFLLGKGRELVKSQAPNLAKVTDKFSFLYSIPDKVSQAQKASWLALKAGALGKIIGL